MPIVDIERPRFDAHSALSAAGIGDDNPSVVRMWRHKGGLDIGKRKRGKGGTTLYSVADTCELSVIFVLRQLGVDLPTAIALAKQQRSKLRTVLLARLEHGYWPLAYVRIEGDAPIPTARHFSLSQLAERVIDKLKLPLPVVGETPPSDEAAIIVKVVSFYVASSEFAAVCDRFRDEVLARRRPTNWVEATSRLGVPLWIVREGAKGVAEEAEAAEGAESDTPPISIVNVLRERLGVEIIGAVP